MRKLRIVFPGSRRALLLGAALVVVAVAAALVVADPFGGGAPASGGVVDNAYPTAVASITRQSLSSQTQVSATLGFADPSTINEPGGTAPSDVAAARQTVAADRGGVATAEATLATDADAESQQRASLAATAAKEAIDCAGANAAPPAPAAAGAGAASGGGSSSGACAGDVQSVSAGDQSVTAAVAKVTGDQTQLAAARQKLATDQASLATAESSSASYGQSSTFTTLPAVGQVVRRGQSLYAVGGAPVILLYGAAAPWRAFVAGMSPGRDVAELNANLRVLGYGKGLAGANLGAATSAAIRAFRSAHGMTPSGGLPLGSVVFEAGAVRVTAVTPTLGSTVQAGPVLTITSTVRQVTIELDASQQTDVKVGDPALITLPDNATTPGRISYVGTVATVPSSSSGQGGGGGGSDAPTIEVDVTPTDPSATGKLDQAPINVSITTARVANALVVPVDALLALSSGGYALEEIRTGGVHQLVAVDVGLFDDAVGLVQVTGSGLAAGQRIVVPGE